ncbi:hypothetical protein ACFWMR_01830 [Amycolatopsis thailandensis]|uniref:hypothetical protein n=1 Tax=Amycolatopsis thailandensis TaxID=589330 RepID=UPI003664F09A
MVSVRIPPGFLAAHAVILGTGYLLGPDSWSSGGTFTVVRDLGIPIRIWGAVFLLAGLLLLIQRRTFGHILALGSFTFWGAGLAATLFTGQATGYGGPAHVLLLALVHGLALWQRSQARLDQHRGQDQ